MVTYIGCSNIEKSRQTKGDFNNIKHILTQKLTGWKAIIFSLACKVVPIKSNPTGIPQCSMNWFRILKSVSKDIDSINRNFSDRIIVIISLQIIPPMLYGGIKFIVRNEGDLGIRKTEDINAAFLTKQVWKILSQQDNI